MLVKHIYNTLLYADIKQMDETPSASEGRSLITLFIKPYTDLSLISVKLTSELSTVNNIKSKIVRNDIVSGIKSAQNLIKSKRYRNIKAPDHGLLLCAGITQIKCYV